MPSSAAFSASSRVEAGKSISEMSWAPYFFHRIARLGGGVSRGPVLHDLVGDVVGMALHRRVDGYEAGRVEQGEAQHAQRGELAPNRRASCPRTPPRCAFAGIPAPSASPPFPSQSLRACRALDRAAGENLLFEFARKRDPHGCGLGPLAAPEGVDVGAVNLVVPALEAVPSNWL